MNTDLTLEAHLDMSTEGCHMNTDVDTRSTPGPVYTGVSHEH